MMRIKDGWRWGLLIIGLGLHGGTALLRLSTFWPYPRLVDFAAFYAAAWAWRAGFSPYALPEPWLTELMRTQGIPFRPPPIYNPPWLVLLLQPLTWLPFPAAAWVWLGLNLSLALVCAHLLRRLAGIRSAVLAALLVLSYGPLFLDMSIGQVSVLLLLCALLWLRGAEEERLAGAASGLALATGVKVFPLYWLGAALLSRRWRVLGAGVVVTSAFLLTSQVLAPEANRTYWGAALGGRISESAMAPGVDDQSLLAWATRLTQPQSFTLPGLDVNTRTTIHWMPRNPFPYPVVLGSVGLVLLAAGAIAAYTVWHAQGRERVGAWSLWLLLGLLGLVHMERYNHVLLLPALAWLWGAQPRYRDWVLVAYALEGLGRLTHAFALWLPFPWAAWASGAGLYAVLLTFGVLTTALHTSAASKG